MSYLEPKEKVCFSICLGLTLIVTFRDGELRPTEFQTSCTTGCVRIIRDANFIHAAVRRIGCTHISSRRLASTAARTCVGGGQIPYPPVLFGTDRIDLTCFVLSSIVCVGLHVRFDYVDG
jgi:hypothetical protein